MSNAVSRLLVPGGFADKPGGASLSLGMPRYSAWAAAQLKIADPELRSGTEHDIDLTEGIAVNEARAQLGPGVEIFSFQTSVVSRK